MALSKGTTRRVVQALADRKAANEVIGAIGFYGGFRVNSDATVQLSAGDIQAVPNPGGAAGTYRALLPMQNKAIQSLDWINVQGFTPRNPTTAETCAALVTGYNRDAVTGQWYVTIQIVTLADMAVTATPPAGFTIGVRCAATLVPAASSL